MFDTCATVSCSAGHVSIWVEKWSGISVGLVRVIDSHRSGDAIGTFQSLPRGAYLLVSVPIP